MCVPEIRNTHNFAVGSRSVWRNSESDNTHITKHAKRSPNFYVWKMILGTLIIFHSTVARDASRIVFTRRRNCTGRANSHVREREGERRIGNSARPAYALISLEHQLEPSRKRYT